MKPSHQAATIPKHGVGVVWWPDLDPLCRPAEGLVHVIEVEPETFWTPCPNKGAGFTSSLPGFVAHLAQPKLLHGVGAPFGGSVAASAGHQEMLARDIAALQPAWISDHLSFNRFVPSLAPGSSPAVGTGFFLPPAQCPDGVAHAVANIRHRRALAGRPVAFETPVSYLPPRPGELPDGHFAASVAEAADCGILLDLHNLLCNERNGRQTVEAFCKTIPLDRVWEIHVAGGEAERGFWLDAHSGVVEPALMAMVADIVPHLPALGAIVFEILPDCVASTGLAAIRATLDQLNRIWATRARSPGPARPHAALTHGMAAADALTSGMWEYAVGAAVTGMEGPGLPEALAGWAQSAEPALELYRYLAGEGRASALVTTAPRTIRMLLTKLGEVETRRVLALFWRHATPAYTAAEEAWDFLNFLSGTDLAPQGLASVIADDRRGLDGLAGGT